MTTNPDFSKLLKDGYRFDIGEHLGNGWKLFSKGAGSYIGFILLFFVLYFASGFISALIWPPLFLGVLLMINPLFAGIFVFTRQLTKDHHEFGDFFKGFQVFGQITLFYLVLMLIISPLLVFYFGYVWPWEIYVDLLTGVIDQETASREMAFHMQDRLDGLWAFMALAYIVNIYVGVSYSFALPLIVDGKLGFWQAMETSRKVAAKKFFSIFALYLVAGLIAVAGFFITCGLGMVALVPFMFCINFSAYDGVFSDHLVNLEGDIDSFGAGQDESNLENQSEA